MTNQSKQLSRHMLFGGLMLALLFSLSSSIVRGADTFPITLTCIPDLPSNNIRGGLFTFTTGKTLTINCTAKTTTTGNFSGMLLGTQTDAQKSSAAAGTNMTLTADAPAQLTLQFPAVFQKGTYNYSFALLDIKTHQPIANEVRLAGTIEGDKQAYIISATLDQEKYEWQAPAALKVSISMPNRLSLATDPLFLEVSMRNVNNKLCQTLAKNIAVIKIDDTYRFEFPTPDLSCNNAITIVLKDKGGMIIDEKVVAVTLPEINRVASPATSTPPEQQTTSTPPASPYTPPYS